MGNPEPEPYYSELSPGDGIGTAQERDLASLPLPRAAVRNTGSFVPNGPETRGIKRSRN